jgi:hypothetical protein
VRAPRGPAVVALVLWLALAPGLAWAGDAARDGLGHLRAQERRNRLEDLGIGAGRRLEADRSRVTDTPAGREQARRRWQAGEDRTDFRRDRDREAVRRRTDAEERLEQAGRPGDPPTAPEPAAAIGSSRIAFESALRHAAERERLERLRRDAWSRSGPGLRRWPR